MGLFKMRAFTLKSEIVSVDKSSKAVNAVTKAYDKMTKTVSRESKIAGSAYSRFAKGVGIQSKRMAVSLNNMNASINRTFRKISSSKLALGFGIGLIAVLGSIAKANIELDASIASLQAITGKAGTEFVEFRKEIDEISKSQKLFAGDTAKAFEIVGSAQPILLKNAEALGEVTNAAITLKKAGLLPIEDSAKAVTGTMNQFELGAEHAERVINVLAAGAKEGSANIRELSESMDRVGAVAKAANLSVEQTGAAVELMSKFNLKGSEAGISLKSTLLRLKSAALGFKSGQFNLNDALKEYNQQMSLIKDPIKKAAREEEVFGKIHILTGKILTENIGELNRLTDAMTGTNEATIQANINNNTFKNRLAEISAAWKNSVSASAEQGKQLQFLKDLMAKVADNMDRIIATVVLAIKAFVIFKATVFAVNAVTRVYNILIGIQAALSGKAAIAMKGNTIAIIAMNAATKAIALATKAWVAVQWAINIAMTANPIGLIIVAIAALIAGIILLVKHWKKVKVAIGKVWDIIEKNPMLKLMLFPMIMIVKIIKVFVRNFAEIKASVMATFAAIKELFQNVMNFFKAIGRFIAVIFKVAIIKIVEKITKLRDKLMKLGQSAKTFASKMLAPFIPIIETFRNIGDAIQTYVIDKFKDISEFVTKIVNTVSEFFKKSTDKITAKTEQLIKIHGLDDKEEKTVKAEITKTKDSDKMTSALDKNTDALDKNTNSGFGDWTGRFKTSIIKDANISEKTHELMQKEIATNAINNESNIIEKQKDIINTPLDKTSELVKKELITSNEINTINENNILNREDVVKSNAPQSVITQNSTQAKREKPSNGQINISVIDKTGNKFGLEVESTGIEVMTTGNE